MIHSRTPISLDNNPIFTLQIFSELLIFITIHKTISFSYARQVNVYLVSADNRNQSKLQVFGVRIQTDYALANTDNYIQTKSQGRTHFWV